MIALTALYGNTSAETATVRIKLKSPSTEPQSGLLIGTSTGSQQETVTEVTIPGIVELDLPAGDRWKFQVEAERLWSPRVSVLSGAPGQHAQIDLRPLAWLEGRVKIDQGEEMPSEIELRLEEPQEGQALKIETVCPIQDQGYFACEAPAGTFDLRLRVPQFVAYYRFDQAVLAEQPFSFGTLRFQRGASVTGFVDVPAGEELAADCKVQLLPDLPLLNPNSQLERESAARRLQTRVNRRGFFQFTGVLPGSYRVMAHQKGFAPTGKGPFAVEADTESHLPEAILLTRPIRAQFFFDPPVDPYGHPWRASLFDADESRDITSAQVPQDGVWLTDPVPAGIYSLHLWGALQDKGQEDRWVDLPVELNEGTEPIEVRIPVLKVYGTLTHEDEPLSALFWLDAPQSGQRIEFHSDEEGEFEGYLPQEGQWGVKIWIREFKSKITLNPIDIEPFLGSHEAQIDLEIPPLTLSGQVVKEDGTLAIGAVVDLSRQLRGQQDADLPISSLYSYARTNREGRFRIYGLTPGRVYVQARHDGAESDSIALDLQEDLEPSHLRLIVRQQKTLRGRVLFRGVGQPGVTVQTQPPLREGTSTSLASTITNSAGEFSLSVPGNTGQMTLLLMAPGIGLRVVQVLANSEPVTIPISESSGTLILESTFKNHQASNQVLGTPSGRILPVMLIRWLHLNGIRNFNPTHSLPLPLMESGTYHLCPFAPTEGEENPCVSGVLHPHGTLTLQAPGTN